MAKASLSKTHAFRNTFKTSLEAPQKGGFWITERVSMKKGSLSGHGRQLYLVTSVFNNCIEAKPIFRDLPPISFHDIDYVVPAIARKQGIIS
jgi:hypothetical protein